MINERNYNSHSAFFNHLGIKREPNENKNVIISLNMKEEHCNESGVLSNGIYYTLLDIALGTSITEMKNCFTITINMHVQVYENRYVEQLTCKGRSINITGNIGSGVGNIFDENGNHCASGSATFKIIPAGGERKY